MLKNLYGKVILSKDYILYHNSEEILSHKPERLILFCTFFFKIIIYLKKIFY